MYNNYEEYMQSVLGYNSPNTYRENENYYYDVMQTNTNMQEINRFYPEIYGIVYPVVQKVCSRKDLSTLTEEQLRLMVDEVYNVIESDEEIEESRGNLKNGDVKNPRAKETRRPQHNYLLRDLIRILILRELLSGGRPGFFPGRVPMPGMGHMGGMGNMPPIIRPGNPRLF